ncbi:unnamed protein product [Kluyveromyces dobzhanskii CBS 2104]|uniref:WGS project CCBQ000000000 data, contig 00019 n=1 Tax=Kluyveromyces dobzhanskii CBS 2104 TaxID=1427455 RepID=A0A0A8L2P9_9SACH|nr:unnamed protein product [Kluyveromyces dobzhanskii CBS 2104]
MKKHSRPGSWSRHESGRSRHGQGNKTTGFGGNRNRDNDSDSLNSGNPAGSVSTSAPAPASAPTSSARINIECTTAEQGFTPQQQKAIIRHLLITKNSAPKKDYSHVPCKFFVQGNCQAGESCPFSHDLNNTTSEQVCKYFQKGNCKFGMKCANAHISSNGTRVNPRRSSVPNSSSSKNSLTVSTTNRVSDGISNVSYRAQLPMEQHSQVAQSQFSTPLTNVSQSFMWPPEHTSPVTYNNYTFANAIPVSEPNFRINGNNSFNSVEPNTPQMFSNSYENPSSSQSSHLSSMSYEIPALSGNPNHELQLEETLLPNELSDLLTPNEYKRRDSFKMSTTGNRGLSTSNPSSFMSTEPRLSNSSSSSASDYAWRTLASSNSNQNLDYWRNLELVENNLKKFSIDEQDEDQFNDYRILHGPAGPQMKITPGENNISIHDPNVANDTQFSFDDLHGGIY